MSETSRAVYKIAKAIRDIWGKIRLTLVKFAENIEIVDPQLKNNAELIALLIEFEYLWSIGQDFLVDYHNYKLL